jgi:predicted enzyme related to lactoylglutathione lyase
LNARATDIIDVPSLDQFINKIEQHGGTVCVPKMAIQGVGWLAFAQDPQGNVLGIMEADKRAK